MIDIKRIDTLSVAMRPCPRQHLGKTAYQLATGAGKGRLFRR